MTTKRIYRSGCILLATCAALSAMSLVAASAGATVLFSTLYTYKASVDVQLDVTEDSNWRGIKAGCFAPQEEFGNTYKLHLDSRPKKSSVIKSGVASLTPASFGITPNYGDKGSFRQSGQSSGWTLETQYPAGCGDTPAPPVPSWATAPTCKTTSERLSATLVQSTLSDPDADLGSPGDGVLVLQRTPKAKPALFGANIGDSCYRTLHDVVPVGNDSLAEISLKSTFVKFPIPELASKMKKLTKGSKKSQPSFSTKLRISGVCQEMKSTPFTGQRPEFTPAQFSFPHEALGNIDSDPDKSTCTIAGKGRVTVRRIGPVVATRINIG